MLQLSHWLYEKGRDYQAGVEIFKRLDIDSSKNAFLTDKKPTAFKINLLRKLLFDYARIYDIKPEPFVKVVHSAPTGVQKQNTAPKPPKSLSAVSNLSPANIPYKVKPVISKNPHIDYNLLPKDMQMLYDQCGELYNQQKSLHAILKTIKTDASKTEDRADLCKQIVDMQATIRTNWRTIDDWWLNRDKVTEAKPADAPGMSDLEKDKRIKANMNYLRRYFYDKTKQDEVAKRRKELDDWGVNYEKLLAKIT
jgi:hypothetical protein